MISKKNYTFNNNGSSILVILIVIGAIGASSAYLYQRLDLSTNVSNLSKDEGVQRDLENFITNVIDCNNTFPPDTPACNSSKSIDIKNNSNSIFVKANGTSRIGRYLVKASCIGNTTRTIKAQYRLSDQRSWSDLIPNVPIKCLTL